MALSNDLISEFVKITNDTPVERKESTVYGTIVKQGDETYVRLDGSELLTPISTTIVVNDGDRVIVTIKNHTAIVTGDLTNPSASNKEVVEIGSKISEFEVIIADKVTTEQLQAEAARITKLESEYAEIDKIVADDIQATNAKFETIEGKVAEIDTIKADVVDIDGKVTAQEAEFETMRADIADFKSVTTGSIKAIEGEFNTLESNYADFEETVTNKLTANDAKITELETKKLDTETANAKYANIDFSNIGEAAIEKLFSDSGIIEDLIMSDGKVTGELVGVTIKGDLIEGNTVKADKLVIKGTDGLYYKLNIDALREGDEQGSVELDEKYQNGLDGSIIVANSITADRLAVTDLVAFGATIGGFRISDHALYSGVKSSIDNQTRGLYLGDDGQISIGDTNNYLRYYVDENGDYQLELRFGGSTIGETVNDLEGRLNNQINEAVGTVNTSVQALGDSVSELTNAVDSKVNAEDVDAAIKAEMEKGVEKIQTSVGYKFDKDGLNITKTGSAMSTIIDEDGMTIKKNDVDQLVADNTGVTAYDLHAKTYLIVGDTSRFEDTTKNVKVRINLDEWVANSNGSDSNVWGKIGATVYVEQGETYYLSAYRNGVLLAGNDYGYAYAYAYNSSGGQVGTGDYLCCSDTIRCTRTIDDSSIAYLRLYVGPKNYVTGDKYTIKFEKVNKKQTGCFWIGNTEV